jgi:hypothetical protein
VIQTVETEKGVKINSPAAYAKRCVTNNPSQWRSRYVESQKISSQKDFILQDWQIRQTIALALQNQDYEYAIATFEKYPELHDQILDLQPEWSELLTGMRRETSASVNKNFLVIKLAMLKVKIKLRLSEEQIVKTREQIKSLERLVALSMAICTNLALW